MSVSVTTNGKTYDHMHVAAVGDLWISRYVRIPISILEVTNGYVSYLVQHPNYGEESMSLPDFYVRFERMEQ